MEMLISFSSRTLAPAHSAKTTSKWFADHDITVLDWPANMPDLNPIWNLKFKFKFKLSFIVIPLHVGTYSGTKCRASQDHGAT